MRNDETLTQGPQIHVAPWVIYVSIVLMAILSFGAGVLVTLAYQSVTAEFSAAPAAQAPPAEACEPPQLTESGEIVPAPVGEPQILGPQWNTLYDEMVNVRVTVDDVQFLEKDGYSIPREGFVFAWVDVTVENLGPGVVRFFGPNDFIVQDKSGAMRENVYLTGTQECDFEFEDYEPESRVTGCIAFEVPANGPLTLLYALEDPHITLPGRYLAFALRR